MLNSNQFDYFKSQALSGVSLLDARMSSFSYNRHSHQEYCLGATCRGEQHFSSSGETHRSYPGNVILFNPDEAHTGESGGDENLTYSMLYIDPKPMQSFLQSANMTGENDYRFMETIINNARLHRQILELSALVRRGDKDLSNQEAMLFDIALTLAKNNLSSDAKLQKPDWRLKRIKDYVHASIGEEISLDMLADIAGLSKYHFLRLFRDQTGITPWQYIINCRVNHARLAIEKGGCLADIIFDCGFSDHSHFNRQFKSIYAITPKKWQQNYLSNK